MDNTLLVVLLAIAVIAILAGVWFYYQRNSSKRLKQRFGPEYDRTVERLRTATTRKKNCGRGKHGSQDTRSSRSLKKIHGAIMING